MRVANLTGFTVLNKKQFLQQLKKFLIDKPLYTMEEFFEH
jgi:hypothetical protein